MQCLNFIFIIKMKKICLLISIIIIVIGVSSAEKNQNALEKLALKVRPIKNYFHKSISSLNDFFNRNLEKLTKKLKSPKNTSYPYRCLWKICSRPLRRKTLMEVIEDNMSPSEMMIYRDEKYNYHRKNFRQY